MACSLIAQSCFPAARTLSQREGSRPRAVTYPQGASCGSHTLGIGDGFRWAKEYCERCSLTARS